MTGRMGAGVVAGLGASLVIALASAAALSWASPRPPEAVGYRAYLASDPLPVTLAVTGADPDGAGPITATESQSGFLVAVSGIPDQMVAGIVISEVDALGTTETAQLVRSMSASLDATGQVSRGFTISAVDPTGLLRIAEAGSSGPTLTYSPPLVELPPEVSPGTTWTSAGTVSGIATYEHDGVVETSAQSDCIDVVTATRFVIEGVDPFVSNRRTTWCRGRGATTSVDTDSGRTVVTVDAPTATDLPDLAMSTPDVWTTATLPFLAPAVQFSVVPAGDGLVLVNSSTEDIVAIPTSVPRPDPESAAEPGPVTLPVTWIQHPGGDILGVTSDGQDLYLTTSRRSIQSFDRAGGVRWIASTPDVAAGAPAIVGDVVVVTTLDGAARAFDRETGAERWSRSMSDAVVTGPVTDGSVAVVADVGGRVSAFDASGDEVWRTSTAAVTAPLSMLPDGSVLVADDSGTVHLVATDGSTAWTTYLAGIVRDPAVLDQGTIVIPTTSGVVGLDATDGSEAWLLADWNAATVWPATLVTQGTLLTMADRLARVSPDGLATTLAEDLAESDDEPADGLQVLDVAGTPVLVTDAGSLLPWPERP